MFSQVEARAIKVFIVTFLVSRFQTVLTRKYPKYAIAPYVGKKARRVHHYETGLGLIAIGLALFLDDIHDRRTEVEYYDRHQIQGKAKKASRHNWVVTIKRRPSVLDECI